jgi:hypothetical protein
MTLVIKADHYGTAAIHTREFHRSNRYEVLGLIGVLGVLAFILSAVSPEDDEIQQEFIQGKTKRECVVRNWKSIPSIHSACVNPVHCSVVPRSLSSFCCSAIGPARVSEVKPGATVFCSRIGGRSPPTGVS